AVLVRPCVVDAEDRALHAAQHTLPILGMDPVDVPVDRRPDLVGRVTEAAHGCAVPAYARGRHVPVPRHVVRGKLGETQPLGARAQAPGLAVLLADVDEVHADLRYLSARVARGRQARHDLCARTVAPDEADALERNERRALKPA